MLKKLLLIVPAVGLLLTPTSVVAHHSFAAEFDAEKPVSLRGALTKVEMTNPHGWIHMDVKGPDGKVVSWAIETNNSNALLRQGLRKTDFAIGAEIVVNGFLAKNGTPTVNGRDIKFADGRNFFLGSSAGPGAPPKPTP
jgi:hypothetical protein